jgi:hypothetical protein
VQTVPVVRFDNRDGVGEYEEHLDLLDCAFLLKMLLMVTAGTQAHKQRSLEQDRRRWRAKTACPTATRPPTS